jgi:hypothetical protein
MRRGGKRSNVEESEVAGSRVERGERGQKMRERQRWVVCVG